MKFEFSGTKEKENLELKLNRGQLERVAAAINRLISSTSDKPETINVEFADSADTLTLERV